MHNNSGAAAITAVEPMSEHELECALEALLLVAREPLSATEFASFTQQSEHNVIAALRRLKRRYAKRGIVIVQRDARFQFIPASSTQSVLTAYYDTPRELSESALEALALVAYLQPVTARQIAEYRDADATHVLQTLQDAGLILCAPGEENQLFFRTTETFLGATSLESLDDLVVFGFSFASEH